MTRGCLFCRIVERELPARIVHETDGTLAFEDVAPKAPVHLLVIPKAHCRDILSAPSGTVEMLVEVARTLARERGVDASGFRLVINTGADGGQTVFHLHLHLLAGRPLAWPPG